MINDVTSFVESQFPRIYREEGPQFVSFIKAYYEWLESREDINLLDGFDIDNTVEGFLEHFKKTYLSGFPFVKASSIDFLVKHIYDYYQSKGTEESVKLLIMMMFGEEASVFKPSKFILKPSSSKWVEPRYIEVESNPKNYDLVDKQITGVRSRTTAIVESVVTKVLQGKYIDILYVSSVTGSFSTGERITSDGNIADAPVIIGSLTSIQIENGGRNFKIGDVLDVNSKYGMGGKVRVKEVVNSTGRVDFKLDDGGSGYTTTPTTDVYISDGVVRLDNSMLNYIDLEEVRQRIERITVLSLNSSEVELLTKGRNIVGVDENGNPVASGMLVDRLTEGTEGTIDISVQTGTFFNQRIWALGTNPNNILRVGDVIESPRRYRITVLDGSVFSMGAHKVIQQATISVPYSSAVLTLSTSRTYAVGAEVKQEAVGNILIMTATVISSSGTKLVIGNIKNYNDAVGVTQSRPITLTNGTNSGTITTIQTTESSIRTHFIEGDLVSIAGNVVTVENVKGDYIQDLPITINGITSVISSIEQVRAVERAVVSSILSTTQIVVEIQIGSFETGEYSNVFIPRTKKLTSFVSVSNVGATDIWIGGDSNSNAIIDLISDNSVSGLVVGQNTSAIGVWGNTAPFITTEDMVDSTTTVNTSDLSVPAPNRVRAIFATAIGFVVGDWIKASITIQTGNEVRAVENVYQVTAVSGSSITINVPNPDFAAFNSSFVAFPSSFAKTYLVDIKTDRSKMISPPLDANGEIIEVSIHGLKSSKGRGATFKIGSIENEEVVFLETDFIKDENVAGHFYKDVRLNGANSGVGFVEGVFVDVGGSGYSNGTIVTFTGGGIAGSEPNRGAQGVIVTNRSGSISYVQMSDHGDGYFTDTTAVLPATTGTVAQLRPSIDYGYGFPKTPHGDHETLLMDLLNREPFTIGTISSLASVNPGLEYDASPFVKVHNRYTAGFERSDFLVNMRQRSGTYISGEMVFEQVGTDIFPKGIVIEDFGTTVLVKRIFFNTAFTTDSALIGSASASSGIVSSYGAIDESPVMGDNADISSNVISADGIITEVDVIDSGWGYLDGNEVTLQNDTIPFVVDGLVISRTEGRGAGYWDSIESHLNSESKIQDSDYYQDYSYEIVSSVPFRRYETLLKGILHVAGSKMFGRFEKSTDIKADIVSDTSITIS